MYPSDHVEVYDLVYQGRGKDYKTEASEMVELARQRGSRLSSLLDVACGTGGHLEYFVDLAERVEGLELSEDMLVSARRRAPSARLHAGDMRDFSLGREFSLLTCMFSSVGHMEDIDELRSAFSCFARHLEPGGVTVVEPWWFSETFLEGYVASHIVRDGLRTVSRTSHTVREGQYSVMDVHFVVADSGSGIRHFADRQRLTLFTKDEYEKAFEDAGLAVEYIEGGPSGRGLFVGTVSA